MFHPSQFRGYIAYLCCFCGCKERFGRKFAIFIVISATGWTIGVLGFDSRLGLGILPFTTASRMALGPTQPPTQWVSGALSLEVKRPGPKTDHSPPSSAEVKNAWSYTSAPPHVFMAWCLVKHRENFILPLSLLPHVHIM
jgi:hypothetical protein